MEEFNHVNFTYKKDSDKDALEDIDIHINAGETIGIIGGTGCGKSSFVNLISRLYDVKDGSVCVGGIDVRDYDLETLRNEVSVVLQKNVLFSGTILDNLRWGDENASEEDCIEACRQACADEFIERMPDKYNTWIEQGGSNVSGGQRQRVAMGRAIVRSPKVFLMDEPLSNLDAKLRVQMRVEISKLHQRLETTIIYVTHDQTEAMTLGTRIVVLKDGIIQQVDTPSNLYNTPNNLFVAGFIGSPQMNLIDAEVVQSGSQVTLKMSDTVSITLPAEKSEKLKSYVGKTVVVGIRPEDIKDDEEFVAAHADHTFEAQVKVYELLGAEVNLHYDIAQTTCTAKVNPRTTARPGDTVKFAMDIARLHVFDKETEQVITH